MGAAGAAGKAMRQSNTSLCNFNVNLERGEASRVDQLTLLACWTGANRPAPAHALGRRQLEAAEEGECLSMERI